MYIKPMEPLLVDNVPADSKYIHSVKWDGVRQLVFVTGEQVRIHNRKLNDRTDTYPEIWQISKILNKKFVERQVVFDGEVVAIDKKGKPNFAQVMKRDFVRSQDTATKLMNVIQVTYFIFDILYINGENIMSHSIKERLSILHELINVNQTNHLFQIVDHIEDGNSLFNTTKELGLEGIVSKDINSIYHQGKKHHDWLKVKHIKDINVVIGGFTVKNQRVNALSLGVYTGNELIYIGNVANGLSISDIQLLTSELKLLQINSSPFHNYNNKGKEQFWVHPKLTLKVNYLEFTDDGRLRHPSVQGFLTIAAMDCRLE